MHSKHIQWSPIGKKIKSCLLINELICKQCLVLVKDVENYLYTDYWWSKMIIKLAPPFWRNIIMSINNKRMSKYNSLIFINNLSIYVYISF